MAKLKKLAKSGLGPVTWPLFLLRVGLGWLFFYAGLTKLINPAWSAAGYLKGAKTLPEFYQWLASPDILPFINFVNEWGLTLIGLALIFGLFTRLAAWLGALMMLLYYFPVLQFPIAGEHSFIVDDHIVYGLALLALAAARAGRFGGLEQWCANLPLCRRFPGLRNWLG